MRNFAFCKQAIAKSFSQAATTYDGVAVLQKKVGNALLKKLQTLCKARTDQKFSILDIGSGTGYLTQKIAQAWPHASIIGIDIAPGMVDFARQHYSAPNAFYYCADADQLPTFLTKVDVLFSNLMFQWSPNLKQTFESLKKHLNPGGLLLFTTFADGTLSELKEAFAQVDPYPHIHPFHTQAVLQSILNETHYQILDLQQKSLTLRYLSLFELIYHLKSLGAYNLQTTRVKGLRGKTFWAKLQQAYPPLRKKNHPDEILATYQIIDGVIQCPL